MLKDIQQEKVMYECEQCDGEIYRGNEFLIYDGCFFCDDDCLREWVMEGVMSDTQEETA